MNQLELDLRNAGDEAEASSYCYRRAEPGETCTLCAGGFEDGEIVDSLLTPTHLRCMDILMAEHDKESNYERLYGSTI